MAQTKFPSRSVRAFRRGTALVIAAGAGASITSSPALGLAEAIRTICPFGLTGVTCPWYEGGGGVIDAILPDPIITGERSIVGLISGLFPLSSHEALADEEGNSRVLIEISASSVNGGDGEPNNEFHTMLRSDATGMLHAAMGNGLPREPDPLARGVAFNADAYAAAIAFAVSPTGLYTPNLTGAASALLAMTHAPTAASLSIPETVDVVMTDLSLVGDFEAEGYLARSFDAIANMTGATIVAPTGDGADANFPPDQQDAEFRTIGIPAGAYNTMGVGSFSTPEEGNSMTYITASPFSGKGRLDARDWRSINPDEPGGFALQRDARYGVDIGAPGMKLRLATAEGEGSYSRDIEFPVPPTDGKPDPDAEEGSEGTRFAAAIAAGAVALLQDAYKALLAEAPGTFAHWVEPRLPNYAVRALLINSAGRSTLWTNTGNQGQGSDEVDPNTNQPLDTVEGGGRLALKTLYEVFQGRPGGFGAPPQPATMDSPETSPDVPMVRLPPALGGMRADGNDPGLGGSGGGIGGIDPPLGGGGGIPDPPSGPFIPDPFLRPRPSGDPGHTTPGTDEIDEAIGVRSIGWDIANVGAGDLDFAIIDPLNSDGSLTATLVWNRNHRINIPNIAAGQVLNIPQNETTLEFENLDLLIYSGDGSGNPRMQVASSVSVWNNVEHVVLQFPPAAGQYIMRVHWQQRMYDVYGNDFVGDIPFALAWRFDIQFVDAPLVTAPVGDLDFDGYVTMADVQMVLNAFGSADAAADVNDDGVVNFFDLNIVLSNVASADQDDSGEL